MNKDVKIKWIEALKTYKQCTNSLRKNDCYCVLDVLCDLFAKSNNVDWKETGVIKDNSYQGTHSILNRNSSLPNEVEQWSEFDGNIYYKENHTTIATLNDEGFSFEKLSKIIEEQL